MFKLHRKINRVDRDVGRKTQRRRREVQQPANPGIHALVGRLLGAVAGNRQNRQPNPLFFNHRSQLRKRLDHEKPFVACRIGTSLRRERSLSFTDLGRIRIENRDEPKSLGVEPLVCHQRPPQIPGSYQHNIPNFIRAQNMAHLADQFINAIADPRMTKLAEIRQVLSDLRVRKIEAFTQLLAGNGAPILSLERFKLAKIKAQPANRRIRNGIGARGIHTPPKRSTVSEADYSGGNDSVKSDAALDRFGPRWEKDIRMSVKRPNSGTKVNEALQLAAKSISTTKPEDAVNICRKILTQFPNDAKLHYALGIGLIATGKTEEAIAAYQTAIRLNPDFFEVRVNLGTVLGSVGRFGEAIAEFSQAARLRPDVAEIYVNLSNALRDNWKIDEAITAAEKALTLKPSLAEAHLCLGAALACRGQFDRAISVYRDAIRIRPEYPAAHLNLALAELVTGNLEQGWPEYEWRQHLQQSSPAPKIPPTRLDRRKSRRQNDPPLR